MEFFFYKININKSLLKYSIKFCNTNRNKPIVVWSWKKLLWSQPHKLFTLFAYGKSTRHFRHMDYFIKNILHTHRHLNVNLYVRTLKMCKPTADYVLNWKFRLHKERKRQPCATTIKLWKMARVVNKCEKKQRLLAAFNRNCCTKWWSDYLDIPQPGDRRMHASWLCGAQSSDYNESKKLFIA